MKLADTYANYCGVKLPSEPHRPHCAYFPMLGDYITIHNGSGMPAKNYDYYAEVVGIIRKHAPDLKIVQIGLPNETILPNVVDLRGKTNLYQCNYLVKEALLHIGNDSVWAHNAGAYGTPIVVPYGPTLANVCFPAYHTENSVAIESHRNGGRATHSPVEEEKTINFINPEEIANAALQILDRPTSKRVSRFIGDRYHTNAIEVVPDHIIPNELFAGVPLNIRMDLGEPDITAMQYYLGARQCNWVIDKTINPDSVRNAAKNIICLMYKVTAETFELDYVKALAGTGVEYIVITEDEESLPDLKLALLNYNAPKLRKPAEAPEGDFSGTLFKSSKVIASDGKFYLSEWHFNNKQPIPSLAENVALFPEEPDNSFWRDKNHFYIYEN